MCQTADEASHDTEHIGPDRRKQSRDFCFGNDIDVGAQRKISGGMHEVEDLAKARGLAVAFDHTAPAFYRVSLFLSKLALKNFSGSTAISRLHLQVKITGEGNVFTRELPFMVSYGQRVLLIGYRGMGQPPEDAFGSSA